MLSLLLPRSGRRGRGPRWASVDGVDGAGQQRGPASVQREPPGVSLFPAQWPLTRLDPSRTLPHPAQSPAPLPPLPGWARSRPFHVSHVPFLGTVVPGSVSRMQPSPWPPLFGGFCLPSFLRIVFLDRQTFVFATINYAFLAILYLFFFFW